MGCGVPAETHLRVKINPEGKMAHPNIEPLCSKHRRRLLNQDALGYMTEKIESVNCLACLLIVELGLEEQK